jgi:glycosyltransferase involved in cell wall biosynthesis
LKKFFFVSNMYPSSQDPTFGVFVQRSFEDLCSAFKPVDFVVINDRRRSIRKFINYVLSFFKIITIAIRGNFDFVYVHYLTHTTWALVPFMSRRKCIINIHGFDFMPVTRYQKTLAILNKYILKKSRLVVVPSEHARRQLLTMHPFLNEELVFVNYSCGVDRKNFFPRNSEKSYDLIYISRIDQDKGWRILIDAIARIAPEMPALQVAMCGAGSEVDDLKNKIKNLGLSQCVDFVGALDPNSVPEWMCKSRFFVFPTPMESLGLVSLEALSCGIPVITYDRPPMNDFVVDGVNGFLFEKFNENDLAKTLRRALFFPKSAYSEMCADAATSGLRFDRELLAFELTLKLKEVIH